MRSHFIPQTSANQVCRQLPFPSPQKWATAALSTQNLREMSLGQQLFFIYFFLLYFFLACSPSTQEHNILTKIYLSVMNDNTAWLLATKRGGEICFFLGFSLYSFFTFNENHTYCSIVPGKKARFTVDLLSRCWVYQNRGAYISFTNVNGRPSRLAPSPIR